MFSLSISVIRVLHRLWSSCTTKPQNIVFITKQHFNNRRNDGGEKAQTYHGSPGFEEPVEAELRGVADALTQLVVHALLVEAQLVEHADEEAVLFLCVVLAFVGAVRDTKLMEGSLVATDLHNTM